MGRIIALAGIVSALSLSASTAAADLKWLAEGIEAGRTVPFSFAANGAPANIQFASAKKESRADGGFDLDWIARARMDGDRWDGEAVASGSPRFRVRVLDGADEKRAFEVETTTALYGSDAMVEDFPSGLGESATLHVAQFGAAFGWGVEAQTCLIP
jgi:hypothetical protein